MQKRLEWIDALKGFGIFLVVFGHLAPEKEIDKYIYAFHIFLFFAVSGFLYNREAVTFPGYFMKKLKALIIPYLFWNISATLITIISGGNIISAINSMLTINGGLCWDRPIWFLPVLFFAIVIYALIDHLLPFASILCLLVSPVVWYFLKDQLLLFRFEIVPIAIFFFAIGVTIKQVFTADIFVRYRVKISAVLLLICAILHIVVGVYINGRVSYTASFFGNHLYCILAGLGGVVFYFTLFSQIQVSKILVYLGKRTMFIMCSHYWFLKVINYISLSVFDYDVWRTKGTFKAFVASIALLLIICLVMHAFDYLCKKMPVLQRARFILGL